MFPFLQQKLNNSSKDLSSLLYIAYSIGVVRLKSSDNSSCFLSPKPSTFWTNSFYCFILSVKNSLITESLISTYVSAYFDLMTLLICSELIIDAAGLPYKCSDRAKKSEFYVSAIFLKYCYGDLKVSFCTMLEKDLNNRSRTSVCCSKFIFSAKPSSS